MVAIKTVIDAGKRSDMIVSLTRLTLQSTASANPQLSAFRLLRGAENNAISA